MDDQVTSIALAICRGIPDAWEPQRVVLGPCECPGNPHGEDVAYLSPQKAAQRLAQLYLAAQALVRGEPVEDPDVRRIALLPDQASNQLSGIVVAAAATVAWDLQDETGAPIPISADTIGQLSGEGAAPFALWIDRVLAPGFAAWVSTLAS